MVTIPEPSSPLLAAIVFGAGIVSPRLRATKLRF
jgi:hypothetical protein